MYLAEDLHLMSRLVVVKFLHEQGRSQPGRLVKFLQEAEALARLDHPGIVAAFDADETPDGGHFLVMQYVDGRTLRALIEEDRYRSARWPRFSGSWARRWRPRITKASYIGI